MASIKRYLGFAGSSSQKPSVDNTGVVLSRYSESENVINFSIVNGNTLKPAQNVDWVISDKYVLLSFALARDWGEKLGSAFEKPKVHLVIQGKNYAGNDVLKKIYTDEGLGNNVDCKWDGYFGIIRVSFLRSELKDFNRISYIGVIIARDNSTNGSDSISQIFKIDQDTTLTLLDDFKSVLASSDRLDGFNTNNIETVMIENFSRITKYDTNPVSSSTQFGNGKIFILPANLPGQLYALSGSNSSNPAYTHNKYYYNQVIITFQTKSFSGVSAYPSYCSINNGGFEKIEGETLIKSIGNTADYQPEIILVYGGYQYKMGTNVPRQKLRHYSNFLSPTEEEFLQFFAFDGERYRTKFVNYTNPNLIGLQTVISGTLKNKNPQLTPYRINEAIVEDTITLNNTSGKPSSSYEISFSNIFNNFTNTEEGTIKFYLPLIDEYKYYNLGEVALLKSETKGINFSCYNRESIVKHHDLDLIDKFTAVDSAFVFDVTEWANRAVSKSWEIQNSDTPLDSISFGGEGVMETEASEDSKSYFSYYRPVIKLSEQDDITSITKMPIERQFYTVLYCQPFLDIGNTALGLKIKNGTLFYTFPEGSFDCNTTFKDNDFINYAISENENIGLSDQGRNEHFTLTISNSSGAFYSIEISTSGIKIGTEQVASRLFFHELLTNFYCGTERTLQLPGFSTSSSTVSINFKYEKSYAGSAYTIFEKTIQNVPVASGDRPLGLRKGGIIVNPLTQNEALSQGTAEQINLKTKIIEGNKLIGKGINILVCDPNGNSLNKSVAIEYQADYDNQTQTVSNEAFYFDGVNVSALKNTVNNLNTNLVKKVDDNETAIATNASNINTLKNKKINFVTVLSSEKSTHDDNQAAGIKTLTTTFELTKTTWDKRKILSCNVAAYPISTKGLTPSLGWTFDSFLLDVGQPRITSFTDKKNETDYTNQTNRYNIVCQNNYYNRTDDKNETTYYIALEVYYIEEG